MSRLLTRMRPRNVIYLGDTPEGTTVPGEATQPGTLPPPIRFGGGVPGQIVTPGAGTGERTGTSEETGETIQLPPAGSQQTAPPPEEKKKSALPWILGGAALAIAGGYYLLTRKPSRRSRR